MSLLRGFGPLRNAGTTRLPLIHLFDIAAAAAAAADDDDDDGGGNHNLIVCDAGSRSYPRGDQRHGEQLHVRHVLHDGRVSLLERLDRLVGHARM